MLNYFRLILRDDLRELPTIMPVIYALCFDVEGILVKIGWTKYPSTRLVGLIREQALQPSEIWIADYRPEFASEYDSYDELRSFAGRVHRVIDHARTANEFFRLPMTAVDTAFGKATSVAF